jgi:hypothetical protein
MPKKVPNPYEGTYALDSPANIYDYEIVYCKGGSAPTVRRPQPAALC